jgi:hypothetical protein
MADDPNNTKAAFDRNWVSATEVGEHLTQVNAGGWILAPLDIREAVLGGCSAVLEVDQGGQKYICPPAEFWSPRDRLRWVHALNPKMRREDYHHFPWQWVLRAYILPSELIEGLPLDRQQASTVRVFLHRAEAALWGLLPALESPQAMAGEELPSPDTRPNASAVGVQTSAHAGSAPEQPDTEPTEVGAEDTAAAEADRSTVKQAEQEAPGPGRPSSADLVVAEAKRRLEISSDRARIEREGRKNFLAALRIWLNDQPNARRMTAKTIGDHLRRDDTVRELLPKAWLRRR